MTGRRPARRRRSGAHGTTLIELLVTIAVLAGGFVALLAAFAQTELAVSATSADAKLTSQGLRVSDYLGSSAKYVVCASPADYDGELSAAGMGSVSVIQVLLEAPPVSHDSNGATVAATPITGGACTNDYGLQRITIHVADPSGRSVNRTVFKRWD